MPFDPEEYLASKQTEQSGFDPKAYLAEKAPQVIQEMHPDLKTKILGIETPFSGARFVGKNLANSPEAFIGYLKRHYPEHEFKNDNDQIQMKRKNETNYRVVDPAGFDWQDITDSESDILQGALEAGAGGLGALAGAATTGGAGSLPAAMGAAGTTGAMYEAARQKLGAALGIPQEVKGGDVLLQGLMSAGGTGLFGAGAGKSEAKGLLKKAYEKGTRDYVPKLLEATTGIKDSVWKFFGQKEKEALQSGGKNAVDKLDETGIKNLTDATGEKILEAQQKFKSEVGNEINQHIKQSGKEIDISNVKKIYNDKIAELESKKMLHESDIELLDHLKRARSSLFDLRDPATKEVIGQVPDVVDASLAEALKARAKEEAKFFSPGSGNKMPKSVKDLIKTANDAYHGVNNSIDEVIGEAAGLRQRYKMVKNMDDFIESNFYSKGKSSPDKNFKKTYDTLTTLDNPSKRYNTEILQDFQNMTGADLSEAANLLKTNRALSRPGWSPLSGAGSTSTTRTLAAQGAMSAAMTGAGGAIGYNMGKEADIGPGGPRLFSAVVPALMGLSLGSPALAKQALKYGIKAEQAAGKLPSARPLIMPAWNLMSHQTEKK